MTEANERAVKQILQILRRFRKGGQLVILRKVRNILRLHRKDGDMNTVIWHVYRTRIDAEPVRLEAA